MVLFYCGLCLLGLNLAPFSQPTRSKKKKKGKTRKENNRHLVVRTRFPALGVGYMLLLRVLIGQFRCLHWFCHIVKVITLGLISQHSNQNRSKNLTPSTSIFRLSLSNNNKKSDNEQQKFRQLSNCHDRVTENETMNDEEFPSRAYASIFPPL